jgi:hypothetical protein
MNDEHLYHEMLSVIKDQSTFGGPDQHLSLHLPPFNLSMAEYSIWLQQLVLRLPNRYLKIADGLKENEYWIIDTRPKISYPEKGIQTVLDFCSYHVNTSPSEEAKESLSQDVIISKSPFGVMVVLSKIGDQVQIEINPDQKVWSFGEWIFDETISRFVQQREPEEISEQLSEIDRLCIKWVSRKDIPHKTMPDFLSEFTPKDIKWISVDQFKKALKGAGDRGLIYKGSNGRWKVKIGT